MFNFGSKYAFVPKDGDDEDEEEVYEEDFEDGLMAAAERSAVKDSTESSSSSSNAGGGLMSALSSALSSRKPAPKPKRQLRKKKIQAATTNVIRIELGRLAVEGNVTTGDPTWCEACAAGLSVHAVLTDPAPAAEAATEAAATSPASSSSSPSSAADGQGGKGEGDEDEDAVIWLCEFCGHRNVVVLEEEEIPKEDSYDYLLEAPPTRELGASGDAAAVVFAVDVSGSMCTSYEVEGVHKLKGGSSSADLARRLNPGGELQQFPGQRRNITYVSRLQCVQASIESQIEAIAKDHPDRRVSLITFGGDVTVIGDGSIDPITISGDKLESKKAIEAEIRQLALKPISETKDALLAKLWALQENGPTALGPAVVAAAALGAQGGPGSSVVVATDGLANVGIGSLEDLVGEQATEAAEAFYKGVAEASKEAGKPKEERITRERELTVTIPTPTSTPISGVQINLVSIGTEAKIEILGLLCDVTNGEVDVVEPLELTKNFSNVLSNATVATECEVTLMVHKGLTLRASEGELQGGDKLVQDVGNVAQDSCITFEYSIKSAAERAGLNIGDLKHLPFQLQVRYRRLDGAKIVRIITKAQEVVRSRTAAEQEASIDTLAAHAVQSTAVSAQSGDYMGARTKMLANQRLMSRAASSPLYAQSSSRQEHYQHYLQKVSALDSQLQGEQLQEAAEGDDFESASVEVRKVHRKAKRSDKLSNALWRFKKGK